MLTMNEVADYLRVPHKEFETRFKKGEYQDMPYSQITSSTETNKVNYWFDLNEVMSYLEKKYN